MNVILDILMSEYFIKSVLFLLCLASAFAVTGSARKNKVFGKTGQTVVATWQKFLKYASEATERRLQEEERLQKEQGNREKKNFFYRMDELLIRTGVRRKFPFVTVELALLAGAIISLTVLIVCTELSGSIVVGFGIIGTVYLVVYETASFLIRRRQRKVEDNILHFANLIENYARTTDDIISIFRKISIYLDEPLRSAIETCYMEAYTSGDFATACNHLEVSIGNRFFSDLIANIEICSRHRANYEEVIHGNKEIIRKYLSERDVRREMAADARMQILAMLIMGVMVVFFLDGLFEQGILGVLSGNNGGTVILGALVIFVLYIVHTLFSIGGEET